MCIFGAENATIEKKKFCLLFCLLLFICFENAMPPESYPKKIDILLENEISMKAQNYIFDQKWNLYRM